jgi:hypothetical protein
MTTTESWKLIQRNWAWKKRAGMKVPSRKALKELAERYRKQENKLKQRLVFSEYARSEGV